MHVRAIECMCVRVRGCLVSGVCVCVGVRQMRAADACAADACGICRHVCATDADADACARVRTAGAYGRCVRGRCTHAAVAVAVADRLAVCGCLCVGRGWRSGRLA